MAIEPIGPLRPELPRLQLQPAAPQVAAGPAQAADGPAAAASSFSAMLGDAIAQLDALNQSAESNVARLATGEPVDLHEVMLSLEQSNLGFQLAMQVRNRLIEAYQEISRMPV
jgi:flagellar hook-basal body complex protein FliE